MTETLSKSFTVNIVHLQNQQFQLWDSDELKDGLPPQRTMSKKNYFHYIIVLSPFLGLIIVVILLSMEGQKALEFHKKYLNWCSEVERKSGNDMRVSNFRICIFG